MDAQQIKQAHLLDIIFEGRNKSYGAYELRSHYNKRVVIALMTMLAFTLAMIIFAIISPKKSEVFKGGFVIHEVDPTAFFDEHKPVAQIEKHQKIKVAASHHATPLIIEDDQVTETPPSQQQIEKSVIGFKTEVGEAINKIEPPIESENEGTGGNTTLPIKEEVKKPFVPIEKDASFPGGNGAWAQYILNAINKRIDEFDQTDYGTCIVRFAVDENGNVSDVHAISMKGSKLAEIATNAIRKGPKWIPAIQNGKFVSAYRLQPVTLLRPD